MSEEIEDSTDEEEEEEEEETEVSTDEEEEIVVRTDEEKEKMYKAMLDGADTITSVLNADNPFYNDQTNAEKQKRILRSASYLEFGKTFNDWGSEDFSVIDAAIDTAKAYTP